MAKKKYYVIDGENQTLYEGKEKDDAPQVFTTFIAAEQRAKEAAATDPGAEYKIVGVEAIVACEVGAAKTTPVEATR